MLIMFECQITLQTPKRVSSCVTYPYRTVLSQPAVEVFGPSVAATSKTTGCEHPATGTADIADWQCERRVACFAASGPGLEVVATGGSQNGAAAHSHSAQHLRSHVVATSGWESSAG